MPCRKPPPPMPIIKKILIGIITWESRLIIRKYRPFVVAVTGSVGKTSTKDAIFDALSGQSGFVRKSEKSMNSDIGLPLTVIGVANAWYDIGHWLKNIFIGLKLLLSRAKYPDCLILEIGADHPGDIKRVARWLKPDIAVMTRISRTPVHVEFFRSPEEVFEEKASLAEAVKPGGTLVVFADDEKVMSLGERVKGRGVSVLSYGFSESASVRGSGIKVLYEEDGPVGISFDLRYEGVSNLVSVKGVIGETQVYPILAAVAVAKAKGVDRESVSKTLYYSKAPRGRMNLLPGINGSTLIDDTYNSSPDAALAAINVFKGLQCVGSKIAVLGDMMELGKFSAAEHKKIGEMAPKFVDKLVTVGQRSKLTAEEALKNGMISDSVKTFDDSREAAIHLRSVVRTGDIVLIKGSQSIRMERITAALLREPEKTAKLLVRQEKEWLAKE